jgi:hypothetical protein
MDDDGLLGMLARGDDRALRELCARNARWLAALGPDDRSLVQLLYVEDRSVAEPIDREYRPARRLPFPARRRPVTWSRFDACVHY